MIQAQELRLGNYVRLYLNDKEYNDFPIELADFNLIANKQQKHGVYEPIELSTDILEKAGFRNSSNKWFKIYDNDFGHVFIIYHLGDRFEFTTHQPELKYVHQLQNLYFSLTGEELTINL